jgi:hypothetical protein
MPLQPAFSNVKNWLSGGKSDLSWVRVIGPSALKRVLLAAKLRWL